MTADATRYEETQSRLGHDRAAFDNSSYEHSHFLDLETGEVLIVAEELSYAESSDGKDDTDAESDEDMPEWQWEAIKQSAQIVANPDRYVQIPRADSREGYRDIQDFIATVTEDRIAELLEVVIQGAGAFRRFKDVLSQFPAERKSYFQFKKDQTRDDQPYSPA